MMDQAITWAALFAAGGTVIALITFWVQRGKVEGDLDARVNSAAVAASTALAKVELVAATLNEARLDWAKDLQNYATVTDLEAVELRVSQSLEGVRSELRGVNQRLDRIIEVQGGGHPR